MNTGKLSNKNWFVITLFCFMGGYSVRVGTDSSVYPYQKRC